MQLDWLTTNTTSTCDNAREEVVSSRSTLVGESSKPKSLSDQRSSLHRHSEVSEGMQSCGRSTSLDGAKDVASSTTSSPAASRRSLRPSPPPPPPMLHHRHVNKQHSHSDVDVRQAASLSPNRVTKAKVSAHDMESESGAPTNIELSFKNEKTPFRPKEAAHTPSRISKDGGGNYSKALSIEQTDEEEGNFPDLHIPSSGEDDDGSESDGLIDDDSHNKHQPRPRHSTVCSNTSNFPSFRDDIKERGGWLIGLLFLQSCSSFIIQYNEGFLQSHMVIVQFLTMLVGAGGNAGNQASVRVIRGLAVGTLNERTLKPFLMQEVKMAFGLSALLGSTGFIRAALFRTPVGETIAVTASLCAIVAISVALGSTLPLAMKKVGIDPAHSSTTIQVLMDITGVLITVCVSSVVLSFKVFMHDEDSVGGEDEVR